MKKILFLLIVLTFGFKAKSQDAIVKKDNTEIAAKVQELIGDLIKYKDFDNLDGPIKNIAIADVKFILYANGKKEYFGLNTTKPVETAPTLDAIVKTDRTEIKCKIVEITTDAVKYKNANEVVQSIAKTNVFYILYANGKKEYVDAGVANTAVITQMLPIVTTDIIIKNDNAEIKCTVVGIDNFEVQYKMGDAAASISKIDIAAIKFAKDSKFNIPKPIAKSDDRAADSLENNVADTIVRKDNVNIPAKILDKNGIAIVYKKMDIADDVTYFLSITNVQAIVYAAGIRQNFTAPKTIQPTTPIVVAPIETPAPPPVVAIEKQPVIETAPAVDEIAKTDKSTLRVKVTEVATDVVKYKKIDNIDGPTYTIKMVDVVAINYANGKKFIPDVATPLKDVAVSTTTIIDKPDIIVKSDKSEIKVKIYNVEENEIRYKMYDMQDGPFRVIKKSNVFMIKYANGKSESFLKQ